MMARKMKQTGYRMALTTPLLLCMLILSRQTLAFMIPTAKGAASASPAASGLADARTQSLTPAETVTTRLHAMPTATSVLFTEDGDEQAGAIGKHQNDFASRRHFLQQSFAGVLGAGLLVSTTLMCPPAAKAVMKNDSAEAKTFTAGEAMGSKGATERFVAARTDLQYLLDNYDEIQKGGGDSVRRYLGTVGVTSSMYGIQKVMKELQEEADDIVEYTENMNEFERSLRAADTAAYSANFVEFSAAKTKPEQFFKDARKELELMRSAMDNMATELKL